VLYSNLIEFGTPVKLTGETLNETYSKAHICKNLCHTFRMQNTFEQVDALCPLLFNFAWNSMPSGRSKKMKDWN
jgi:hypothetical protein